MSTINEIRSAVERIHLVHPPYKMHGRTECRWCRVTYPCPTVTHLPTLDEVSEWTELMCHLQDWKANAQTTLEEDKRVMQRDYERICALDAELASVNHTLEEALESHDAWRARAERLGDDLARLRRAVALRAFTAPDADDSTLLHSLDSRILAALRGSEALL